jgi:SAM-dependent methyltransferase
MFSGADVRQYYDGNTRAFLSLGEGGKVGAIHRAVWAPGVLTRELAFHYVEERIVSLLAGGALPAKARVLDLGCGVGGSLIYLARRRPITGIGVTLSPVQAEIAGAHISTWRLADRISCIEADYCSLPEGIGAFDLAYAVESFLHGPDPQRFFAECARVVRPGGVLVICDDFRSASADSLEAAATLRQFCAGWRVNTLVDLTAFDRLAAAAGFTTLSTADLTPWLELGRPRDRLFAALVPLLKPLGLRSARFANIFGGTALQKSLARGWVRYHLVVLRRD